jgi:hypothetical protein
MGRTAAATATATTAGGSALGPRSTGALGGLRGRSREVMYQSLHPPARHAAVNSRRSVSCSGPRDRRAQAQVTCARRPDTPKQFPGRLPPRFGRPSTLSPGSRQLRGRELGGHPFLASPVELHAGVPSRRPRQAAAERFAPPCRRTKARASHSATVGMRTGTSLILLTLARPPRRPSCSLTGCVYGQGRACPGRRLLPRGYSRPASPGRSSPGDAVRHGRSGRCGWRQR